MHELTVFNHSRFIFVSIENVFVFISVLCIQFYFYIISVLLINIVFIFVSVNDCLIISISTIISVTKISLVDLLTATSRAAISWTSLMSLTPSICLCFIQTDYTDSRALRFTSDNVVSKSSLDLFRHIFQISLSEFLLL